jgi:hypothetical protein
VTRLEADKQNCPEQDDEEGGEEAELLAKKLKRKEGDFLVFAFLKNLAQFIFFSI